MLEAPSKGVLPYSCVKDRLKGGKINVKIASNASHLGETCLTGVLSDGEAFPHTHCLYGFNVEDYSQQQHSSSSSCTVVGRMLTLTAASYYLYAESDTSGCLRLSSALLEEQEVFVCLVHRISREWMNIELRGNKKKSVGM